jgi:WhiB family redox-sensing transcriptional regulator
MIQDNGYLAWMDDALCAQTDTDVFFPDVKGSSLPAQRICALCPVVLECLTYALEDPSLPGIWGGTTATDRAAIRAKARKK